jgi:predicted DsbA family dithiol-disulfide isomerase
MTVVIEMVSDLVCPWCWLGKRRIEAAMALVPEIDVQLVFRPFELDPTIPEGGVDYKAYMREKFGSDVGKERSNAMRDALIQYGEDEGIPYNFDKITWRPNSLNAHRLVRWAQGQDLGAEAKEALFKAFFEDGRNIGDINELTDIGASVGLHRDVLETLYASNADEDEVRKEAAIFRQMGVSGVPTYIAHRSIAVQGAESAEKLAKFLKTAADQLPKERPLTGA